MSHATEINHQLDLLRSSGCSAISPGVMHVAMHYGDVESHVVAVEQLACQVLHFTHLSVRAATWNKDQLKNIGEELTSRLTYLLEPIHPQELDSQAMVLQMRSVPPKAGQDDRRSYYELTARRDRGISLLRYEKQVGQMRQAIPMSLTREVIARLADDFDAAANV
ncbi:MAG: hypothetical protein KDA99_02785 [Planctomycetales bacterium]|nr:hypothetical protein [Planctomycetales bacterium]